MYRFAFAFPLVRGVLSIRKGQHCKGPKWAPCRAPIHIHIHTDVHIYIYIYVCIYMYMYI